MRREPAERLLLVDDNARLLENLQEILEESGYHVATAGRCEQALEKGRDGFDVALIDLRLPDGEGTALAQNLKELEPDAEIVLLTGFATVESAAAAVRAGACAYLLKPCATPELLLTIEQAMRQVRLHKEKRELSRRAQVAEKLAAVGTLTAGLSHEIRNPLNAAGIQLTVLERRIRALAEEQQQRLLEPLALVRDEIRRLDHILQDFLQFARPREVSPKPVELAQLIGRCVDLMGADAERRQVLLEKNVEPGLVAQGDEGQLQQVLMNLVLNALDVCAAGGRVRVTGRSIPGWAVLTIEDTGPGIPQELRDRIFEPFFTTKASGSGLGLPIVNAIVTQHGGRIEIKDAEGGGAAFEIRIPR